MSFPDMAHVERLREALWRDAPFGNAAVMVGAGFSRNAHPVSGSSRQMPTWADTAREMADRLYVKPEQCDQHDRAMREAGATSGFLRLAQEFEAAFGRTALNGLIRGIVPNEEYVPGDLHQLLLDLPWAEVLTTNWDTLLEQGRLDVFNRNYHVVRTLSEIPGSKRPRIVKLHGTLPANDPFIFTEEDYRTYPSRFAPFVNLVRQSMMENVFCLIGFSGEDPNFLHWSGWVRDHLNVLSQKIFLVGWLDLSPHRRRMLEERHVVPIDLTHLPGSENWPSGHRHRYATEWFLHMLHQGRPLPPYFWPGQGDPPPQPPSYLKIPTSSATSRPMKEALQPEMPPLKGEPRLTAVKKMIDVWAHNRSCYPGWLIAPGHVRRAVWLHTEQWILEVSHPHPGMMPWDRLFALEALVWRMEIALAPIFGEVVREIVSILKSIDVLGLVCLDSQGTTVEWPNPDWTRARHCWRELALAVVRSSRDDADLNTASDWLDKLAPFVGDDPEFGNKVLYERCLVALSRLDHAELEKLLGGWNTGRSDPFWDVRKAALLAETNHVDQALALIRSSIQSIRRNTKKGDVDLPNLSREGWALFPLMALTFMSVHFQNRGNDLAQHEQGEAIRQRWKELAVHHCDANADYNALLGELEKDPPPPPTDAPVEERMFDLGEIRNIYHFGNLGIEKSGLLPAFQMKRLTELAGLPSKAGFVMIAKQGLNLCALRLVKQHPETAVLLGWRLASNYDDKDFKKLFTRTTIARLDGNFVQSMVDYLQNLADYSYVRCSCQHDNNQDYWVSRLRVAVELLSMLTPRLRVAKVNILFDRACTYYTSELFRQHFWLATELGHLFKRVLSALPVSELFQHVPTLAALPIPGRCQFMVAHENRWPEPFDSWPETPPLPVPTTLHVEIEKPVEELLSAMTESATRKRAARRLIELHMLGVLSSQQQQKFAEALWNKQFSKINGMPGQTSIPEWGFLILPEPENGHAERIFRSAYLETEPETSKAIQNNLAMLDRAVSLEQKSERPFKLSQKDEVFIHALIRRWVSTGLEFPASDGLMMIGDKNVQIRNDLIAIGSLISAFTLPEKTAIELLNIVQPRIQDFPEVFYLFPGLVRSIPEQVQLAQFSLTQLMASDSERQAYIATNVLFQWSRSIKYFPDGLPSPPLDLIREIGAIIRVRRRATILPAITFALWIFQDGPEEWRTQLAGDCIHGLRFLLDETSYDRFDRQPVTDDLPFLRYQCVKLSLIMSQNASYMKAESIKQWLDNASNDPMAEVRNAVEEYVLKKNGSTG
ncbi:MAG: SIR2 family protein, partial [Magnetococcales bacterium]|nr:SIR2 family protein [Magnetococcales bacterium]